MKYRIISKKDLPTNNWNGGKTYEYFIYPPESSYIKRNFVFRISCATIEKVPSVFTRFEHYERYLVMLDNVLQLVRNSKAESYQKNEIFTFDSNDEITSQSLGNDFNVMVRNAKATAKVEVLKGCIETNAHFTFLFGLEDTNIFLNQDEINLNKEDLLLIENFKEQKITLNIKKESIVMFVGVEVI